MYKRGGPAKMGAHKSFKFTESSLVVKIKNTSMILQPHYINSGGREGERANGPYMSPVVMRGMAKQRFKNACN